MYMTWDGLLGEFLPTLTTTSHFQTHFSRYCSCLWRNIRFVLGWFGVESRRNGLLFHIAFIQSHRIDYAKGPAADETSFTGQKA